MIENELFSLGAATTLKVASGVREWMQQQCNTTKVELFASRLTAALRSCLPGPRVNQSLRREKMWGAYHRLRTSEEYVRIWKEFLNEAIGQSSCAIFFQRVGDYMVKELIANHFEVVAPPREEKELSLNSFEANSLRYSAGYVPRALRKKLLKSAHPSKNELVVCLLDMLDDGEDEQTESHEWILKLDRGGLTHITNVCYQLFVAMELHIRRHLQPNKSVNFLEVQASILSNKDVLFYWSIVGSDWEEEESAALLPMVVNLWVTMRGFSNASAWVETYKAEHKKSVQKSKGVRKQLLPAPTPNNK